jgi:hypothetical protein
MGDELRALEEYVVEGMNVWRGVGVDSVSPEGFVTVQLKIRRRGTAEFEERTLLLSRQQAAAWGAGFTYGIQWDSPGIGDAKKPD